MNITCVITCIIITSAIIIIVCVIFYCCFTKSIDSFQITKQSSIIMKAPYCTPTGLGDRIGEYILYSILGKIYNCKVLVYWELDKMNWASRSTDYPNDILNFIKFPDNLIFVSKSEFQKNLYKNIFNDRHTWKDYYFGNELVPELQYKSLNLSNILSFDKYLKLYKETAKEIKYKKILPTIPSVSNNFTAVHIRRGDKSDNNKITEQFHNQRLNNIFNNLKIDKFVLCSEVGNLIKNKSPIDIQWCDDSKIRVLEQFFTLCKASKIIQSVGGSSPMLKWRGWTSFSYIASRIGDSILYSCSELDTRIYHMEKLLGHSLYNVIKYDDIIK